MRIKGEVAVVTGASGGLGAEMARQLARAGLKVGLTARRGDELEAVAASIRSEGGTVCVAVADAGDRESTRSAFEEIARRLGPVDLLVANAGVAPGTAAGEFSGEVFEQMVRVNLIGAGYAIEMVLPEMIRARRGHVVGISSLAAYRGLPGSAGYSATKAGLTALLEGLRPELKRLGITVTAVHPGYVRTPMTDRQTRPMPLLMDVEPAARIILEGIARRRTRVDFPRRMAGLLGVVRLLPDSLYDPIVARFALGKRRADGST